MTNTMTSNHFSATSMSLIIPLLEDDFNIHKRDLSNKNFEKIKETFQEVFKEFNIDFIRNSRHRYVVKPVENTRYNEGMDSIMDVLYENDFDTETIYTISKKCISVEVSQNNFKLLITLENPSLSKWIFKITLNNINESIRGSFKDPGVLMHRIYGCQLEPFLTMAS